MKVLPFLISQSFMNDAFITESDQNKDKVKPQWCPRFLKYKYLDGMQTPPTDAMQYGNYFEWHLLGATRGGVEPILPRIGVRDQRPPKSASKLVMMDYLLLKGVTLPTSGTGARRDLKPAKSASKQIMVDYLLLQGQTVPEKATTAELSVLVQQAPEHLGEAEVTCEDLFELIQTLPPDWSAGELSAVQKNLDQVIGIAKTILKLKGLDVEKGEKQLAITTKEKKGHLDWVTNNIENLEEVAIIDVKYTETKEDDWRNGWGDIDAKTEAHTQASHYASIYHEKHGVWVPFYFFIFGKDGWIKLIKMILTETGNAVYDLAFSRAKELQEKFHKSDWKARAEFNRCLRCPFSEVCDQRALLPEVEEFSM